MTKDTSTTEKQIPVEMWNAIRSIDLQQAAIHRSAHESSRLRIIEVASRYGFTASELETRGVIAPRSAVERAIEEAAGQRVHVGRDARPDAHKI